MKHIGVREVACAKSDNAIGCSRGEQVTVSPLVFWVQGGQSPGDEEGHYSE